MRETTQAREGARLRGVAFSYPAETMDKARYANAIEQAIATLTAPLTAPERATGIITPPPHPEIAATGSLDEIQRVFYDKRLHGWPAHHSADARSRCGDAEGHQPFAR